MSTTATTTAATFRPTVRLRLTLAYGGLFLLAGAILLSVNYVLVSRSLTAPSSELGFKFVIPGGGMVVVEGRCPSSPACPRARFPSSSR